MTEPTDPTTPAPKPRKRPTAPPEGNGVAPPADSVATAKTAASAPAAASEPSRASDAESDAPKEMILALSPKQIIGGFALLAGLIILARRRGRKG